MKTEQFNNAVNIVKKQNILKTIIKQYNEGYKDFSISQRKGCEMAEKDYIPLTDEKVNSQIIKILEDRVSELEKEFDQL